MSESPCGKILEKIKEFELIPLYDVSGGRQRNDKENESLAKHRANYMELCKDHDG